MEPKRICCNGDLIDLPEDVLQQMILPWLPFKALSRLKVVSKAYRALIASDTWFSTHQSLCPFSVSTGFVYADERGLSFFPNRDTIGIPDPSLKFMVKSPDSVKLMSCANGLLLFYLYGGVNSLCVCNPATMKKEIIPEEGRVGNIRKEMGLAFDPRGAPDICTIVDPLFKTGNGGVEYLFDIFRSQTGEWMCSKQTVYISGSWYAPSGPVYARGVLYWFCMDYLLCFDPEEDRAGTIPLPYKYSDDVRQEVVVFQDEIASLCITSEGGIEVWALTGGTRWEKRYELSKNKLMQESPDGFWFGLRNDKVSKARNMWQFVAPLAFDGRKVYTAVDLKQCERDEDLLFSDFELGAEGLLLSDVEKDLEEDLLCCDMETGKVINTGKSVIRTDRNLRVFYYHNSMVSLPPISK